MANPSYPISMLACLLLSLSVPGSLAQVRNNVPVVDTSTGQYQGFEIYPGVSAYLGMRYAEPPTGQLRWEPPQPLANNDSSTVLDATQPFPGCYQLTYNTMLNDKLAGVGESEDCLTISVWKPSNASVNASLPVLVWIYGGGFAQGAATPSLGTNFVAEHQDIVFVSFNYRLNIFGFPNSPAVTKNLGLLDQRVAIEWTRDNIKSFGGDPTRIILAGQSAGSESIALYSYSFANDPIASGFIELSGQPGTSGQDDGSSWARVIEETGCVNQSSPLTELECLKNLPPREIKRAVSISNIINYGDLSGGLPAVDNKTVFSQQEYVSRGMAGQFARVPTWVSTMLNEGDNVTPFNTSASPGINLTISDYITNLAFLCPTSLAAQSLVAANTTAYRTIFSGVFPALQPYPWARAYHGEDSLLLFGSEKYYAYQDPGPNVLRAGEYYRNAVAAFVRDPRDGLARYGWPKYNGTGQTLVNLFPNQAPLATFEDSQQVDAVCAQFTGGAA